MYSFISLSVALSLSVFLCRSLPLLRLFNSVDEEKKETDHHILSNETINIFSVASGHLYERFLRYVLFF